MSVVVVTPPVPDIDLDLVKAHLRVDHDDDDALIGAYIAAAVANIDGPAGWLGRSIWQQTLELRQNIFGLSVRLPYGPPSEIVSIKYVDSQGTEQTLSTDQYLLTNGGEVALAYGEAWPSLRGDADGVRIRYVAGAQTVPPAVLSAVLLMVGDIYANRETVGDVTGQIQMSTTVQALLGPYRFWAV